MKHLRFILLAAFALFPSIPLQAYERLQGPTELLYWDKTNTYNGYTFFGVRSNTYLIDMEGRVAHTWPVGTNPHLLTNGNVLDAAGGDVNGFTGLQEVDWDGNTVWSYTESRAGYAPHHDFLRIYNRKLGTNTTLYIASKAITWDQCIGAGCNPASAPYTNVTVDAIVEVDPTGTVVWEWCFFDHGIQDYSAALSNYVGSGKSISNYPGRLNLNLPGRPLTNDWLHCNAIDYNTNLDQIVITAAGGEFYVIDHGNTFLAGDPAASIALAASTNGDFLYRFGDPARYGQGNPPSITANWSISSTGNKQIGACSDAQWIPAGCPGAGHFLVYNNGGDLFETTPQSYIFEINGYLNASTNDTGAYVNPPTANYYLWSAPGHDTDKQKKYMSRPITWIYYSMANQGMFSHLDSGIQRLPNGNTLVCDSTEGHIFEITSTATNGGTVVWEYVNPISADGIITYKRDNWPTYNYLFRAHRYPTNHPALAGRTFVAQSTITGSTPSYISAPTISSTTITPSAPAATNSVWVTAQITNSGGVASATLTYTVASVRNIVDMLDDGLHQDGAAGDGIYGAQLPAYPAGTNVSYYVAAQDQFGNIATDTVCSYTVQAGAPILPPVLSNIAQSPAMPTGAAPVTISAVVTDDLAVASVTLTYSIGTGLAVTNSVFTETMATNAVKPWTGPGCDNAWTVSYSSSNPFEQRTGANYGTGNANGLEFKGGTTNLTDSMMASTGTINAGGSSGFVEFYLTANSQSGTSGWTFQVNGGAGFVTRLSELTGTNHTWQLYHYDLQSSELVSNLAMRFQFRGGLSTNRIDLDQISVKVVTGGTISSNISMSVAGNSVYAAQIPAQPAGTSVSYSITAWDSYGLTTNVSGFSYLVVDAANLPAASFTATPTSGGGPLPVTFTDTSTGIITNRFWSFGDGFTTNATATDVVHTYQLPGTNTVQLIVTGPLGSSTSVQSGLITATSVDTVGDGIPNWWRAHYFGGTGATTNTQSCAVCDPDGDGMSNWQEYLADTNPTNSASLLALVDISPQTNGLAISWIGGTASIQIVECRRNLADPGESGTALFTNTPPTAITNTFVDAGLSTNVFYRIKAWR
jgi:PKD repeat protein